FVILETRIEAPMFQLSLFRIRAFTAGNLAGLAVAIARGGLQFMLIICCRASGCRCMATTTARPRCGRASSCFPSPPGSWSRGRSRASCPTSSVPAASRPPGWRAGQPPSGHAGQRLRQHGVAPGVAHQIAALPPVSSLFAAVLGVNPLGHLLAARGGLAGLPATARQTLTGREFFPGLISGPFQHGLVIVFVLAAVLAALAALASALRGARPPRPTGTDPPRLTACPSYPTAPAAGPHESDSLPDRGHVPSLP